MTSPLPLPDLSDLLDALEDLELPLLAWGVTNGALAHSEIVGLIENQIDTGHLAALNAQGVIQTLIEQGLLFRLPGSSPPRYRTRMAEALRLTTQLRQLFVPRDVTNPPARWWDQGRPLVADYRLHVAARQYPRRDLPTDAVLAELEQAAQWSTVQSEVAAAQIAERPLARFQVQATSAVSIALSAMANRGVIVGAGTGSGKTLAFYLPAFAAIAEDARPGHHRLHTVALYPRKELLRDQLREAVNAARQVGDVLAKNGRRPLRIGALYGDTPRNAEDRFLLTGPVTARSWQHNGADRICPFLPCPECGSDMVWPEADRTRRREVLACTNCSCRVEDQLALTRDSLCQRPPDLLFTTTEMLNRNGSDHNLGRLLGWQGGGKTPALVLLDEVHTYTGVHGAQVALLLRRWRHAVRRPVTFVGLSATLRNAETFFAELTGLEEIAVDHIEPQPADLEDLGRQYSIALRGDPVSGVSLLSVSIQTAMLYARILDMPGRERLFGSRGFIFTDDLDVNNRFYDDLRDAEGAGPRFARGRLGGHVLAGLRSPDAPQSSARFDDGQSWDLARMIGHALSPLADSNGLRVGRTTSQDSGVDRDADVIVATASLEVGFNDPRVGLVMQHKAPRDAAAFIQRQGRAGRRREMRPITVVTLSDYGRDRLAYQAFDTLFAPEIPPRHLPVGNRYVLKIQATQALLDWLGRKLTSRSRRIDPRVALKAPAQPKPSTDPDKPLIDLLDELLDSTGLQDELANHLRNALRVSNDEASALLWEQPRALLLGVVPTALRRLRSGWRPSVRDPGASQGELLPEYITAALYDALNVPEVSLTLPFPRSEPETLSIERALREAVPGRVSRRYGHRNQNDRTWLPLPGPHASGWLDVELFAPAYAREGQWRTPAGLVEVVRPQVISLSEPPTDISDRSQGTPQWISEILVSAAGPIAGSIPNPSTWARKITSVGFATHAAGNPATTRRMTPGAQCETVTNNGQTTSSQVRYRIDGSPAALGFSLAVDGLRITVAPLDVADAAVFAHLSSPAWRRIAFTTAVREDPSLNEIANIFQRDRLIAVYLTAFVLAGIDGTRAPQQIQQQLTNGAWAQDLANILQILYRDTSGTGVAIPPQKLINALEDLSRDTSVRACLDRHAELLWTTDIAADTTSLAQRCYRDTLAAAILAAGQRACPDAQDTDLIVDVVPPVTADGDSTIWLTETTIGGLGVVEQLASYYARDPRRFWGLVDSALAPSDLEYVDATLTRLLTHVVETPNGLAANAMRELRDAPSSANAQAALARLRQAWTDLDGNPRHGAVAALSTRLLRRGSDANTDRTVQAIMVAWTDIEQRLGIEIDAQIIAYAVATGRLNLSGPGTSMSADQVFSMLWPRGNPARVAHLDHYQPYTEPPILDRLLAAAVHYELLSTIDVTANGWQDFYRATLGVHNAVELVADTTRSEDLADAIRQVAVISIDRDVLRIHGEVTGLRRFGADLRARIELRAAVQ
ncbi:protein DpdJ [Micromonospora rubida]|uniref:protein DpdJ n=1 Tax=Micromonospora rubida TaxID=2697657 RepID=UPI0013786B89|nr:protein DpdJ [Micromonospora rubida]NBE85424.1 DEAD/DEAH box helicase [Micromonospora rubida]